MHLQRFVWTRHVFNWSCALRRALVALNAAIAIDILMLWRDAYLHEDVRAAR